jgi:hypothetical protein
VAAILDEIVGVKYVHDAERFQIFKKKKFVVAAQGDSQRKSFVDSIFGASWPDLGI